jgi:glycosyltransferase involved in cell wall biosynthesis
VVSLCGSIKPLFSGTDDYTDSLIGALQERGIEVHPVNLGHWNLSQAGRLLSAVAAARPDAILMQYPTDAFGGSLAPHAFAVSQRVAPLVVTLHEFTGVHVLRRLSIGPLLVRSARVVATAEREASSLVQWYPWLRGRLRIIPIGPNVPPRQWVPAATPEVVYFGQIRPEKGLEEFITCRDRLMATLPQTTFTIIGSSVPKFGSYFDKIAAEARSRAISIVTGLNKEQVSDRLAACWVALLPFPDGASFRRGSLLAAAVCGVPIVTKTGPDTPADLAALLTPVTTVEDFTALVRHLLNNPTARQAAHEQSRRMGETVAWSGIADNYIDTFRDLSRLEHDW